MTGMREPVVPQFDADTYLMWESRQRERFELHHGFLVAFAGSTVDHDRISFNLRNALDRLFPAPCRSFGSNLKIRIDDGNFFYSDAGVLRDDFPGTLSVIEGPRVVAEVLSPSTRSYDLIEKRAAYRGIAALEAYVIVHTSSRQIELDVRDADGRWHTVAFDEDVIPLGNGVLTIDEVYRRSSLDDV